MAAVRVDLENALLNVGRSVHQLFLPYLDDLTVAQMEGLMVQLEQLPHHHYDLLRVTVTTQQTIVPRLVEDFGGTFRALYYGLRELKWRRPERPVDAVLQPSYERKQVFLEERGRCAITGAPQTQYGLEVAHIVPYRVGMWRDGQHRGFFRAVSLIWGGGLAGYAWRMAGGTQVNSGYNMMALQPSMHRMWDDGDVLLKPIAFQEWRLGYVVRFREAQTDIFWNTTANGPPGISLFNGLILVSNANACGPPFLHHIVNRLNRLLPHFRFIRARLGDRVDLGGPWSAGDVDALGMVENNRGAILAG